MTKPSILTVDLPKIIDNWKQYKDICPNSNVSAVIKADAYGTGMIQVYTALKQAGCDTFWVATINEALKLKSFDTSASVSVLGGIDSSSCTDFITHNITPVINSIAQLELWAKQNSSVAVWLQFNTHMNRFGIDSDDVIRVADILKSENVVVHGYMSHLLAGEESRNTINKTQKDAFDSILEQLPPAKTSLCNTASVFLGKDYHCDVVRLGIGLYGVACSDAGDYTFKNPLSLKAPVQNIRTIEEGHSVGYNASFVADSTMKIATIGIGYGDGINVALSNTGNAYYYGKTLPIVGRISMDSMGVDVTEIQNLSEGDMITIFDSADDISIISACASIPEQTVLASLLNRIVREYI